MLPIIAAYKKAATTSPMIVPIGGPARFWSTGVGNVGTSFCRDYRLFVLSPLGVSPSAKAPQGERSMSDALSAPKSSIFAGRLRCRRHRHRTRFVRFFASPLADCACFPGSPKLIINGLTIHQE